MGVYILHENEHFSHSPVKGLTPTASSNPFFPLQPQGSEVWPEVLPRNE